MAAAKVSNYDSRNKAKLGFTVISSIECLSKNKFFVEVKSLLKDDEILAVCPKLVVLSGYSSTI